MESCALERDPKRSHGINYSILTGPIYAGNMPIDDHCQLCQQLTSVITSTIPIPPTIAIYGNLEAHIAKTLV